MEKVALGLPKAQYCLNTTDSGRGKLSLISALFLLLLVNLALLSFCTRKFTLIQSMKFKSFPVFFIVILYIICNYTLYLILRL